MVRGWLLAPCLLSASSCIAEKTIDQIVADHGVTWIPESSSGDSPGETSSTGTSTGSSSGAPDDTSSSSDTSGDVDPETTSSETSETSETSTGDSTTGVTPFCGDGIINGPLEECDDGNADPDDRCVDCYRARLVFTSSLQLSGETLNGLTNADAVCKSSANKAKQANPDSPIVDPGNFKAFLSTSEVDAIDRHFPGNGPYFLVNGLRVSRSFAALFSEPLENTITVDENSETQDGFVWTGSGIDGKRYPGIDFCGDWHDAFGSANFGYSEELDTTWLHFEVDPDCLSERPIYCFEQE